MDEEMLELLKVIVRDDLGMTRVKFFPMSGGNTGAYTSVLTAPDGREAFLKWAHADAQFGVESLKREIRAHHWLPASVVGSAPMLAARGSEAGIAAAFGVDKNFPVQKWTIESLTASALVVAHAHTILRQADAPIGLADAESRLARALDDEDNPWRKEVNDFADMAFEPKYANDICHTDLHRGNLMVPKGGGAATIVDWAWVSRMPSVFDIAMLAVDAALDGIDVFYTADVAQVNGDAFRLALGAYGAMLWVMEHNEHKHARTRKRRREAVEYALS